MSGDAQAHVVDLDDALITWAMDELGSDYTVEKVDASKVCRYLPTAYHLPPYRLPAFPSEYTSTRSGGSPQR